MPADAPDLFADLLLPGETVLASVAAAGPPRPDGARVWQQLALTAERLLVVILVQAPHGGAWQPVGRHAAPRGAVRLARYPRTPGAAARVEVHGLPEALVLVDVDDPAVFPWLEPFLAAWGGPIEGAGNVTARPSLPEPVQGQGPDPKLLMAIAGGMLALALMCLGCSGLFALL